MPPRRFRSVVLPEPDGPITATKSPRGMVRSRPSKIEIVSRPLVMPLCKATRRTIALSGAKFVLLRGVVCLVRGGGVARPHVRRRSVLLERDLHGHVGEDAGILAPQPDADLDGRLVAV